MVYIGTYVVAVPRFSLAIQCRVVRNTQASVYHQSERGKKEPAEYGHRRIWT